MLSSPLRVSPIFEISKEAEACDGILHPDLGRYLLLSFDSKLLVAQIFLRRIVEEQAIRTLDVAKSRDDLLTPQLVQLRRCVRPQ